MVDYTSISIPKILYEKLKQYSEGHDLTIRRCSKVLIEGGMKEDLCTYYKQEKNPELRKLLRTMKNE